MGDQANLARLADRAATVAGKARRADGRLKPATVKKYQRYQGDAEQWHREAGRATGVTIPWTSEALADYAVVLLQRGYAKATAMSRLNAVRSMHRVRGLPVPDGVAAWFVLRGGDHTADDSSKVNNPPTRRGALTAVAAVCDVTRAAGARDLCLATLAWDLLAGEAELVALDIECVTVTEQGLVVRLAGGSMRVDHDHDPELICAVEATVRWLGVLEGAGATRGPLFRSIDKGGNIGGCGPKAGTVGPGGRLNTRGLQRIWKGLVARAGLPPSTPRSLRLGGAEDDVAGGASLVEVLRRGRWSPNTVAAVRRLIDVDAEEGNPHDGS